jgi:hypothetical protein
MIKEMLHSVFVMPFVVFMYMAIWGFSGKRGLVTIGITAIATVVTVAVKVAFGSTLLALGASGFVAYALMLGMYRFDVEAARL